ARTDAGRTSRSAHERRRDRGQITDREDHRDAERAGRARGADATEPGFRTRRPRTASDPNAEPARRAGDEWSADDDRRDAARAPRRGAQPADAAHETHGRALRARAARERELLAIPFREMSPRDVEEAAALVRALARRF